MSRAATKYKNDDKHGSSSFNKGAHTVDKANRNQPGMKTIQVMHVYTYNDASLIYMFLPKTQFLYTRMMTSVAIYTFT
jgi:hypothetical protein